MRALNTFLNFLAWSRVLKPAGGSGCKCTPEDSCWPSPDKWSSLNTSLSGALIRGVPPGAVCYQAHPTYNENHCEIVRSQWFNSTWHAQDPISVDYPIWTDNSCNPIYPNGTSVTGDVEAGKKGCSIGRYSVYVVNATTAEHASKALKWAQKHNIRVVVKSTGHSFPGRSTGYGSLSIWTHNLRGIQYTESFSPTKCPVKEPLKAVRVAAGHTGIEVQAEVAKSNVIIVTGANPDVGLIGWLTGGGHGVLSTSYGMGADNLLEATIVTPDGKTLVANPCQNSDLFFAIRGGGGGTFGVVLEAIVQAFPTPKTTLFTFAFAFIGTTEESQYWDLVGFIHAEMARLKEGGMQGYYYMPGPPVYPTLAFQGGFYLYNKPEGTVETLVAPIVARLVERPDLFVYQSSIRHSDTFWDSYNGVIENEQVATGGAAFGSRLLSPESLADPNATAKAFAEIGARLNPPTPNGMFHNPVLIGHMIASPNEPTYYPSAISMNPAWRNTLVHFVVVEGWPEGVDRSLIDAVYEEITYNKTEVLRQLSPNTGAYFNEADSYEPKWQESFFGKHYARLRKIKEKYDPHNILWCMRCVGSEALVEQQNGRLCKPRHSPRSEDSGGGVGGKAPHETRTEDSQGGKRSSGKNSGSECHKRGHIRSQSNGGNGGLAFEARDPTDEVANGPPEFRQHGSLDDKKREFDQRLSFTRDIEEETDWHKHTPETKGHFSDENKESGWNHRDVNEAGAHHLHEKRNDDPAVWVPDNGPYQSHNVETDWHKRDDSEGGLSETTGSPYQAHKGDHKRMKKSTEGLEIDGGPYQGHQGDAEWTKRSPDVDLEDDGPEADPAPDGTPYRAARSEHGWGRRRASVFGAENDYQRAKRESGVSNERGKREPNQTPAFDVVSKNVDSTGLSKRDTGENAGGAYGIPQSKRQQAGSTFKIYTLASKTEADKNIERTKRDPQGSTFKMFSLASKPQSLKDAERTKRKSEEGSEWGKRDVGQTHSLEAAKGANVGGVWFRRNGGDIDHGHKRGDNCRRDEDGDFEHLVEHHWWDLFRRRGERCKKGHFHTASAPPSNSKGVEKANRRSDLRGGSYVKSADSQEEHMHRANQKRHNGRNADAKSSTRITPNTDFTGGDTQGATDRQRANRRNGDLKGLKEKEGMQRANQTPA